MKFPIDPANSGEDRRAAERHVPCDGRAGRCSRPNRPRGESPRAEPGFSRFAGIVSEPSPIVAPVKIDVGVVVLTMFDPTPVTEKIGVRVRPPGRIGSRARRLEVEAAGPRCQDVPPAGASVQDIALRVADPGVEQGEVSRAAKSPGVVVLEVAVVAAGDVRRHRPRS